MCSVPKPIALVRCLIKACLGRIVCHLLTLVAICVLAYIAKDFALSLNQQRSQSMYMIETSGTNICISCFGTVTTNIFHFSSQVK